MLLSREGSEKVMHGAFACAGHVVAIVNAVRDAIMTEGGPQHEAAIIHHLPGLGVQVSKVTAQRKPNRNRCLPTFGADISCG